uniref:Signal sequence receptor subunit 2 n=1 Tax=Gopherus evgoodei TaxID=1825980 RepID=A0A8C4YEP5_9SAUR
MKLLALAVFALLSVAHSEEGARLLASKSLLNRYAVEGKDLTLQYNIYNVGSSAALDVELSDDSFPPEDFGIVSGMLNVKWDRIAPASNVSHTVVLRPLKAGYFNFTSATITYLAQEGGQVVVGFTSAPGQGGILAQREFDRRFSPHFVSTIKPVIHFLTVTVQFKSALAFFVRAGSWRESRSPGTKLKATWEASFWGNFSKILQEE